MLFRTVSAEVKPVRRATARGGKMMLQSVIVRRLRRGRRILGVCGCAVRWGLWLWLWLWLWLEGGRDGRAGAVVM